MLRVHELRIEIGARRLVDDASFTLAAGEKVALVGPNGAGKTTLLRTLAGEHPAAAGRVERPASVGWLAQETAPAPGTAGRLVFDHLVAASPLSAQRTELDEAAAAMADSHLPADAIAAAVERYGELESAFSAEGGYNLDSTAERIAAGLGLDTDALLAEVGSLSGGQRRRLELARLLLAGGDLLVLDEPTNHLDAEAKAFVMGLLRSTSSAVLVVSHDIELMNDAIDRVLSLEAGRLTAYRGTYAQFLRKRAERTEAEARVAANAATEIARLERTADRFRQGNATSARRRRALEGRIERINRQQADAPPPPKRTPPRIRFPDPARSGDVVLRVDRLNKRLGAHPVLSGVGFTVSRGERLLVVGPNGAGKTTLLRCLAGVYTADSGSLRLGANVAIGYYAQEHDDIPAGASVFSLMQRAAAAEATTSGLRAILGHFGLTGDVADQEASTLSGGEKTKLSLARLVAGRANLLLLDEPTNNLDPASREAVLGALTHYRGTVVLVSHDADFVNELAPSQAVALPSGKVLPFDERMIELVTRTEPDLTQGRSA
ncbi:MAG: ABC-F family ATP-binding cassette domain-containing protein [Acidimicrobiales bacterium]